MVEEKIKFDGAIIIPISGRETEIHAGHIELIKYAKTLGDPIVVINQGLKNWMKYLISADFKTQPNLEQDITAEVASVKSQGVKVFINKPFVIRPRIMIDIYKSSFGLAKVYKEELLIDRYFKLAVATLMSRRLAKRRWRRIKNSPISVRGPEVLSFFQKSVSKLMGWGEVEIMPTMVKDSITKIRCQGSYSTIPKEVINSTTKFRDVVDNAKQFYKVGRNSDLEKELNLSYKKEPWDIGEVVVWEGGMVKGRLELTTFIIPNDAGGSVILEEVDYHD